MKALSLKLLAVQSEIGKISKESTNPFYQSKYFDINGLLEALKPVLVKEGLVVLQPLSHVEGKPAIKTIIIDPESGETLEDTTILTENSDPQKMGSSITYFRRYALQSMFLLQAEDDDGNLAKPKQQPTQSSTKTSEAHTIVQCDQCKGTNTVYKEGEKNGKKWAMDKCQDCQFAMWH